MKISFKLLLILAIFYKLVFNQSGSNTTSNSTDSNSTDGSTNITANDTNSTNTSTSDYTNSQDNIDDDHPLHKEEKQCRAIVLPKTKQDCSSGNWNYTSCCLLVLTKPFQGNTCVSMDSSLWGQSFENFNNIIPLNYSIAGSLYCKSLSFSYSYVLSLIYLLSFVILMIN